MAESGWKEWPPRLPDRPIFYPVLTFDYAGKIEVVAEYSRCARVENEASS